MYNVRQHYHVGVCAPRNKCGTLVLEDVIGVSRTVRDKTRRKRFTLSHFQVFFRALACLSLLLSVLLRLQGRSFSAACLGKNTACVSQQLVISLKKP